MKQISIRRETADSAAYEFSDYIDAFLGTGASQAVTVPTGATRVSFSSTGNFFVKFAAGGTAAVPAANVTNGTASALNPTTCTLNGLASFALIASPGVTVVCHWYNT